MAEREGRSQGGKELERESPALSGLDRGRAFGRRNLPAAPLLSSSNCQTTHPSLQELTRPLPPPSTCCPPRGEQSLGGGGTDRLPGPGLADGSARAPSLSPTPSPKSHKSTAGAVPHGSCSHTFAPPEARIHTLTPLTAFPRCTLLFHGLGRGEEWGGVGQGGASSLRGDNGGGQGGRGLS